MRRNSDDDEHPFDIFGEIEEMMNELRSEDSAPVDVREFDDRIEVVADLPGTEESDIDLQCDGRTLAIRASTEAGPYVNRVDLPGYVDERSTDASYNNGVLEITLDRGRDPANIGFY